MENGRGGKRRPSARAGRPLAEEVREHVVEVYGAADSPRKPLARRRIHSISEVRRHLSELVRAVAAGSTVTIGMRGARPMCVLIDTDRYEKLRALEDLDDSRKLAEAMAATERMHSLKEVVAEWNAKHPGEALDIPEKA